MESEKVLCACIGDPDCVDSRYYCKCCKTLVCEHCGNWIYVCLDCINYVCANCSRFVTVISWQEDKECQGRICLECEGRYIKGSED